MSGYGLESGRQHVEEYLNVKAVWIKTAEGMHALMLARMAAFGPPFDSATCCPLRPADVGAKRLQFLAHRTGSITLDLAVTRDQRGSEWRQRRSAPVFAAGLPLHGWLAADAVDLVHKVPSPLVGHVHCAAAGRNRSELLNFLQQLDLARPDPALRIEVDTQAQCGQR